MDGLVGARRWWWVLSLYPGAGEAGGCLVSPLSRVGAGGPPDPERATSEAVRRARSKVRRYGVANRLNRLGTLTYRGAGCHDERQLRADVAEFFKALRPGLDGERFPYVWVPEWHPGGHGLHVHFAVGRYVPQTVIRKTWGRGHVHIKLLSDLPVGSGTLAEARKAAGYLCKYLGKSLDDQQRETRLHRYEVAQGFQPERILVYGANEEDAISRARGTWDASRKRSGAPQQWRGGVRRQPAGSPGPTDLQARARAWAERSCLDQQLPVKITDRTSLLAAVAILGASSPGTRRNAVPAGEGAQASDPPDGG